MFLTVDENTRIDFIENYLLFDNMAELVDFG